jgi:Putative quorum-sensing-regulated virulence factor
MPASELSDLERKLLRLALCEVSSACRGHDKCSEAYPVLAQPQRGERHDRDCAEGHGNGSEPAIRMSHPDYGLVVMPWGKHKGSMFMDIPPNYLRWARHWIHQDEERAQRFQDLAASIEQFLQQT